MLTPEFAELLNVQVDRIGRGEVSFIKALDEITRKAFNLSLTEYEADVAEAVYKKNNSNGNWNLIACSPMFHQLLESHAVQRSYLLCGLGLYSELYIWLPNKDLDYFLERKSLTKMSGSENWWSPTIRHNAVELLPVWEYVSTDVARLKNMMPLVNKYISLESSYDAITKVYEDSYEAEPFQDREILVGLRSCMNKNETLSSISGNFYSALGASVLTCRETYDNTIIARAIAFRAHTVLNTPDVPYSYLVDRIYLNSSYRHEVKQFIVNYLAHRYKQRELIMCRAKRGGCHVVGCTNAINKYGGSFVDFDNRSYLYPIVPVDAYDVLLCPKPYIDTMNYLVLYRYNDYVVPFLTDPSIGTMVDVLPHAISVGIGESINLNAIIANIFYTYDGWWGRKSIVDDFLKQMYEGRFMAFGLHGIAEYNDNPLNGFCDTVYRELGIVRRTGIQPIRQDEFRRYIELKSFENCPINRSVFDELNVSQPGQAEIVEANNLTTTFEVSL